MKILSKSMQGASNNSTGSLIYQAFLLVILFFVPNFVPKILYPQNKQASSKDSLFIQHIVFIEKTTAKFNTIYSIEF